MNTPIVVNSFKNGNKKTVKISIVVIALVLLLVGAGLWWRNGWTKQKEASVALSNEVCSSAAKNAILSQAVNDLEMGDLRGLGSLVAQIRQSPGYNRDINCLYILVAYYQRDGNAGQAQIYLNNFNAAYRKNSGVSSSLTGYMPVKTLQADTSAMISAYRKEQSNIYPIRSPE